MLAHVQISGSNSKTTPKSSNSLQGPNKNKAKAGFGGLEACFEGLVGAALVEGLSSIIAKLLF